MQVTDKRISNCTVSSPLDEHRTSMRELPVPRNPQSQKSCCCSVPDERVSPSALVASSNSDDAPRHTELNSEPSNYSTPNDIEVGKNLERPKTYENTPFHHGPTSFQMPPTPQTTVYSMPATYATAENPLTQRQQAYFQQNGHFYAQQVPHYAPLGVIGSAAPPAEGNAILSLTHTCTCGPSCQCVFCVAHPYNATTRDRVQSLAHLLPDDMDYVPKSPVQSSYGQSFRSGPDPNPMVTATNRMHINEILQPPDLPHPPHPPMFSSPDFSGGIYQRLPNESLGEVIQPSISSAGYLTMEYNYDPMELSCTDPTGTCRCGNDCDCIGCLTHSGHDGERF